VPLSDLREGDLVLVRPGQSVAADGIVQQGASSVNESMITGESRPVEKRENDRVVAGTLNGTGSLRVTVTHTGDRTALAGIMRLVEAAQSSRSRAQDLADRAAFWLTVIAVGAGAVTLAGWIIAGQTLTYAIARLVTVLVIACPHALGLAIPLVIAIATTLAASSGLLVRNRRGLEEARRLDTVVFDKTGTLTRGEFGVVDIATATGMTADDALRLAAAVEHDSEHSVARGIVRSAAERKLALPPASDFAAIPGHGVSAYVNGREVAVGGPALIALRSVSVPTALRAAAERASSRGQSALYLLDGDSVVAVLAMADVVRAESKPAIAALHRAGLRVVMMTGDAEAVANAVAADLGIDTVFAGVLPGDKAGRIQALRDAGHRVAMVGDGVNDAPALATATVGIAIGAGTEVAVEAGDVVLVRCDPRDVAKLIALSRASWRKMIQNLWWAVGYNVVAIPLAAGVLAPVGIVLTPAVGAILMSLSTVIVALNAQLLRRVTL
jgi:Cu2+-exporting ATPase